MRAYEGHPSDKSASGILVSSLPKGNKCPESSISEMVQVENDGIVLGLQTRERAVPAIPPGTTAEEF